VVLIANRLLTSAQRINSFDKIDLRLATTATMRLSRRRSAMRAVGTVPTQVRRHDAA